MCGLQVCPLIDLRKGNVGLRSKLLGHEVKKWHGRGQMEPLALKSAMPPSTPTSLSLKQKYDHEIISTLILFALLGRLRSRSCFSGRHRKLAEYSRVDAEGAVLIEIWLSLIQRGSVKKSRPEFPVLPGVVYKPVSDKFSTFLSFHIFFPLTIRLKYKKIGESYVFEDFKPIKPLF